MEKGAKYILWFIVYMAFTTTSVGSIAVLLVKNKPCDPSLKIEKTFYPVSYYAAIPSGVSIYEADAYKPEPIGASVILRGEEKTLYKIFIDTIDDNDLTFANAGDLENPTPGNGQGELLAFKCLCESIEKYISLKTTEPPL